MNEGFIMLHRKILNWEWKKDPNTFSLFVHLLLIANHTSNKWRGVEIQRGQVVTSVSSLAENTGLSIKNVRTSLNRLKSTNEVAIETTNKYSMITICKYDCYQSSFFNPGKQNGKQSGNQEANKGQSRGKQRATNNNNNKEKNDNNAISLSATDTERLNEVIKNFNFICKDMPRVRFTNGREQKILDFLKEIEESQKEDKELQYTTIFFMASESSYLNGENERYWRANFDWILKNWMKIYEGNYNAD